MAPRSTRQSTIRRKGALQTPAKDTKDEKGVKDDKAVLPAAPAADVPAADPHDGRATDNIEVELPPASENSAAPAASADSAAPVPVQSDTKSDSSVAEGRASGRSGRRSTRRSSQRSGPISARRQLTPEQQAARKAAIRTGALIVGGAFLALVLVFVAVKLLGGRNPRLVLAEAVLHDSQEKLDQIRRGIDTGNPDQARERYLTALKALAGCKELGNAVQTPNREQVVDLKLALRAYELRVEIEKLDPEITKASNIQRVQTNFEALTGRLAKLSVMPDADLDKLDKDLQAFCENPVEIGGARNDQALADFKDKITETKRFVGKVADERARRLAKVTTDQVTEATSLVYPLVQLEKYQEAEAVIDERARKFPQADFAALRDYVVKAAEKAWETVEKRIANYRSDYTAAGSSNSVRAAARQAAIERLDAVIATWGKESFITKAKDLKAQFGP